VAAPFHVNGPDGSGDDLAASDWSTDDAPRLVPDGELDRRIKAGWEEWTDLLDGLVSTAGMLPSRELVGRVLSFFDEVYWSAEDARVEALRRQYRAEATRRCRNADRSWGLDGR
jgi:hypothetical protein